MIGSKPPSGYTLVGARPGLDIRQQAVLERGHPPHEGPSILGKGNSGGGGPNTGNSHFPQPKAVSALVLQNQTVVRREIIEGPVHHQPQHTDLLRGQGSSSSVSAATVLAPATVVLQSGPGQHLQQRLVDHAAPAPRQVLLTTGPVSPSATAQIFYQADGRAALVGSARIPEGLPAPTSLLPRLSAAPHASSGEAAGPTFSGHYSEDIRFDGHHRLNQKDRTQSGQFGGNDEDKAIKEDEGKPQITICFSSHYRSRASEVNRFRWSVVIWFQLESFFFFSLKSKSCTCGRPVPASNIIVS